MSSLTKKRLKNYALLIKNELFSVQLNFKFFYLIILNLDFSQIQFFFDFFVHSAHFSKLYIVKPIETHSHINSKTRFFFFLRRKKVL